LRDVLERYRSPEECLNFIEAIGQVPERLVCPRKRKQRERPVATDASPAQMVGNPSDIETIGQSAQPLEVVPTEKIARSDVHAMLPF
jgi:hypothetical protein